MTKTFTSKQYFAQLNIIYFAQAIIMLIFTAIVFGVIYSGSVAVNPGAPLSKTLTYVLAAVIVTGFAAAHFVYSLQLSKIDSSLPLQQKMPRFIGALLIRSACLELPGLFAGVVFFLNGNFYLLLIPVFIACVFVVLRPTPATIAEELNLTPDERAMLNDPNAIIAEVTSKR